MGIPHRKTTEDEADDETESRTAQRSSSGDKSPRVGRGRRPAPAPHRRSPPLADSRRAESVNPPQISTCVTCLVRIRTRSETLGSSAALSDPGGRGAGMARFEVNGKSVQGVDLLRRRHWASRLDFWPFLALYALWLLLAVPALDFSDALIVLAALSAAHILAFLFTAWSVDFRAFVGYSKASCLSILNPSSQHYPYLF